MTPPHRRRVSPRRPVGAPLANAERLAGEVRYSPSPYHKPDSVWVHPVLRPDATKCPVLDPEVVLGWLCSAIVRGHHAPCHGRFPGIVWHREGEAFYEARLTNRESGEYHGYPISPNEYPEGLP